MISFALVVGGFLGVIAGYFCGRLETVIMTAVDALLAFPSLVLLLALVTFVADNDANLIHITLAIGVLAVAPFVGSSGRAHSPSATKSSCKRPVQSGRPIAGSFAAKSCRT